MPTEQETIVPPESWLVVELDVERIRRSRSRADNCEYTADCSCKWLIDAGFKPHADRWLVRAADLGQVQPDEVLSVRSYLHEEAPSGPV